MNDTNQKLMDKAIKVSLEKVIDDGVDESERKEALRVATELLDRQNESEKIEDAKKTSKIGVWFQAAGVAMPVVMLGAKFLVDRKHIKDICKLEQVDTLVTSAGKGLVRSWFQFK